ncbi:hypothetical protein V6Z11_D08G176300 [Gossypium hirsutum]
MGFGNPSQSTPSRRPPYAVAEKSKKAMSQ